MRYCQITEYYYTLYFVGHRLIKVNCGCFRPFTLCSPYAHADTDTFSDLQADLLRCDITVLYSFWRGSCDKRTWSQCWFPVNITGSALPGNMLCAGCEWITTNGVLAFEKWVNVTGLWGIDKRVFSGCGRIWKCMKFLPFFCFFLVVEITLLSRCLSYLGYLLHCLYYIYIHTTKTLTNVKNSAEDDLYLFLTASNGVYSDVFWLLVFCSVSILALYFILN